MLSRTMTLDQDSSVTGGMSITGCLNDFSLYVFHPYGGGRKVRTLEQFSPRYLSWNNSVFSRLIVFHAMRF